MLKKHVCFKNLAETSQKTPIKINYHIQQEHQGNSKVSERFCCANGGMPILTRPKKITLALADVPSAEPPEWTSQWNWPKVSMINHSRWSFPYRTLRRKEASLWTPARSKVGMGWKNSENYYLFNKNLLCNCPGTNIYLLSKLIWLWWGRCHLIALYKH